MTDDAAARPGGGRLGAIVLAGGRSRRFGRDKLREPLDGRPLLHHAVAAVQALGGDVEIVVVAEPGAAPVLPADVGLAHDPTPFEGPLAGLSAGLAALSPLVDRVLVVAGDMPAMVPAVLQLLASTLGDGAEAAILEDPHDPRPFVFPVAFRRAAVTPLVTNLLGQGVRRFGAAAEGLGAQVVPAAVWRAVDPAGVTPRDVDVPEDLASDPA